MFLTDPSAANASLVRLQSRCTDQLHFEKAKQGIFFSKQRIFEHGEHAGKLLAYIAHLDHRPPVVVQLQAASGAEISAPGLMAEEFRRFYSDLYTSTAQHTQTELSQFLQDIDFPTLTHSQMFRSAYHLRLHYRGAGNLPPSKAPGSDGLPLEFYTPFQEVVTPKLQALYTHIFDSATLPSSMGEALIVLIPKPGKDPLFPESYHPISLLQLDVKILAKILAL